MPPWIVMEYLISQHHLTLSALFCQLGMIKLQANIASNDTDKEVWLLGGRKNLVINPWLLRDSSGIAWSNSCIDTVFGW